MFFGGFRGGFSLGIMCNIECIISVFVDFFVEMVLFVFVCCVYFVFLVFFELCRWVEEVGRSVVGGVC